MERSELEQELMDVSKHKPKAYPDRQDELAALVRAVERVSDESFETLSKEARKWYNDAAVAMNEHDDIPDFPDIDSEAEEAADEEAAENIYEDENDEDVVNEGSIEHDEPEPSEEERPKPAKAKKEKAPKRKAKADSKAKPKGNGLDDAPPSTDPFKNPKKEGTIFEKVTGEKDKFGLYYGTKTQQAVALYEKGATAKQVEEALQGRHRNILTRLAKEGHLIEKLEGGVFKVTHRDEYAPSKTKK